MGGKMVDTVREVYDPMIAGTSALETASDLLPQTNLP